MIRRLKSLVLLLVYDPSSEWGHTPSHAMDSVNLCYLLPTLTSLWKPSARSPRKWWWALLAFWELTKAHRWLWLFLCLQSWTRLCIQITAVMGQTGPGGSEKSPRGVRAMCVAVCVRVTKWSGYFQKNRDAWFFAFLSSTFISVCSCVALSLLEPDSPVLVLWQFPFSEVSLWVALPQPLPESSVPHPGMW